MAEQIGLDGNMNISMGLAIRGVDLMKRTTIVADEGLLQEAKHLARYEQRTLSALMEDALREYIAGHRPKRTISCAGIVSVPISLSPEEIDRALMDGLDPVEGWSPDRSGSVGAAVDEDRRAS